MQHAQIAEAQDAISATQADVDRTRKEAARQKALLAYTFGTPQKVEQAVADEQRFEAELAHGQAALQAAQRQMAVLDTEEAQLRAALKEKQAAVNLARIEFGYTRVNAPIEGRVSERGVRGGQYVHDRTQVISVVPLKNVWAIANYKETQLTYVKVGQRAEITIDTFPGVVIKGRVDSISPASGSQFTLITPADAPTIAAVIQTARTLGNEAGNALVQTFVRVREQVYSNLIGLHFVIGSHRAEHAVAQFSAPFAARPVGGDDPTLQSYAPIGSFIRREADVLAYNDEFWLIAWVLTVGIALMLFLRRPPPNPVTPPRNDL